jgi:hypothetical protein
VQHVVEFAGYCARASAANKTGKIMPYAVQNVFILLGPALMAASIYMCLSRIIRGVRGEQYTMIKSHNLTRTFVAGDVLSFIVQGGAAGLMVTGKNAKVGEGIVIAGLMIQIIMFGIFAATATMFHRRVRRTHASVAFGLSIPWQKSMTMLFIVSGLIMFRSIFRVVEYAMGHNGYPLTHEWTLYVFDSIPIVSVMLVYYFWYPAGIVPEKVDGRFTTIEVN